MNRAPVSPTPPAPRGTFDPIDRSRRKNFAWLLGFIIAMQFGYPITLWGRTFSIAYLLAYLGMIYFGVRVVGRHPATTRALVALGAVMVAVGMWSAYNQHSRVGAFAASASVGIFQLVLMASLLGFTFSFDRMRSREDVLLVALSTYILAGGVFAVVYNLFQLVDPSSFVDQVAADHHVTWQTLHYLSYATLTTLGFGDIAAVNPWARSLTTLEAVLGPLFVATVIAQLIGTATADNSIGVATNPSPDHDADG